MLIFSKEVGAKARGGRALVAWAYFLAYLKVRFHLSHCGKGKTKTKGVLREGVATKEAQTRERTIARIYA
jgi:hypothetical protein